MQLQPTLFGFFPVRVPPVHLPQSTPSSPRPPPTALWLRPWNLQLLSALLLGCSSALTAHPLTLWLPRLQHCLLCCSTTVADFCSAYLVQFAPPRLLPNCESLPQLWFLLLRATPPSSYGSLLLWRLPLLAAACIHSILQYAHTHQCKAYTYNQLGKHTSKLTTN